MKCYFFVEPRIKKLRKKLWCQRNFTSLLKLGKCNISKRIFYPLIRKTSLTIGASMGISVSHILRNCKVCIKNMKIKTSHSMIMKYLVKVETTKWLKKHLKIKYLKRLGSVLHQTYQISRCCHESLGSDRYLQASLVVMFFPRYWLPSPSNQSLIWKVFHPLTVAFSFDILNHSCYAKYRKTSQNRKVINSTSMYPIL